MPTSTTLIVGASGATGRLLVTQLLEQGQTVRAMLRSKASLPAALLEHPQLSVIEASVLDLSDAELAEHVNGCDAVASCLGHTLSAKGIWGQPRRLVTDATRRLCAAIRANSPGAPCKFVLMNTVGNRNHDLDERISLAEHLVMGLLRLCVPPHPDNEQAADYLRTQIGQNDPLIQWVAVRPGGLTDHDTVTPYDLHPSPTSSAIFGSGKVSRINVANLMARLITDATLWTTWRGQMPVIYDAGT